ncbi:hypothetical protein GALMADRAFT_132443 [Galerina marginata CBS 339.88]|uniref:Uncharacterized protein n=1 Tax=Galerina marginata (strain CBS 339.88) TaxID=685588 RepID=A0A067TTY2_GALM3|nr:hypothetical protein GALMADRAFT_132443 [Galerina marginata CBS 339.88]
MTSTASQVDDAAAGLEAEVDTGTQTGARFRSRSPHMTWVLTLARVIFGSGHGSRVTGTGNGGTAEADADAETVKAPTLQHSNRRTLAPAFTYTFPFLKPIVALPVPSPLSTPMPTPCPDEDLASASAPALLSGVEVGTGYGSHD